MMRTLLIRGLIAGVIAGIAAALFALVAGEPQVDAAIALEEAAAAQTHHHGDFEHSHPDPAAGHTHAEHPEPAAAADDHHAEEPLVSRDIQKFLGMPIAQVAYGAALGGLFALGFAFVYGRFGASSVRAYSAVLAACGFVAVSLVPFVKYPANPPAVGQTGTIGSRIEMYFAFLGISVIVAGIAAYVALVLAERLGRWTAGTLAVAGYAVVITACGLVLPAVNEVPDGFPAPVLWDFRLASLGTLAVLWAVLGLAFGFLVHRALARQPQDAAVAVS